ncbi:UBA/TS-N domain protein [Aspergillus candidus]|uniref:Auxilin-like protein n=1 Tax=Aspergillus candidus TaxID=41067 RepID=A0A2I2F529_ASPCN|nr:auxilin-like protein [Aspergillus candidus]PLB35749.1 auxilin-like protein [Aspergillus candidus]
MDDLNGLSWSPNSSNDARKPPPMSSGSNYLVPPIRHNDNSGRSTPISASSGVSSNAQSKPATPGKDSFAGLVSFGSSNPNKNLSLVEQQKKLQEERARKDAENRSRYESQYGGQNNQFWDTLEKAPSSRTASPAVAPPPQKPTSPDEDDILAAFDASAPVDASTNFPIPSPTPSPQVGAKPSFQTPSNTTSAAGQGNGMTFMDDDDPFGLNQLKPKQTPSPQPAQTEDDDFLGLLNKPVSEFPREPPPQPARPSPRPSPGPPEREGPTPPPKPSNGVDRAVAELVDMGFPADKSSQALRMTSSGKDVQAAVGLLLTQAHEEARQKSRNSPAIGDTSRSRERSRGPDRDVPSWMQEERSRAPRSRPDSMSPSGVDRDPSQAAAAFGNNFLKAANSFWKTTNKKVQKVVNELNVDHDPSQPKWLKDASAHEEPFPGETQRPARQERAKPAEFTNEALLLETGSDPRPARPSRRPTDEPSSRTHSRDVRPQPPSAGERRSPQPAFLRQQAGIEMRDSRSRASKLAVEEQSAQAYVSPARRKRPTAPSPAPAQNVDLFESPAPPAPSRRRPSPSPAPTPSSRTSTPSTALPARPKPKAPPRTIPTVSPSALSSTHRERERAAQAYKRGDYAAAHEAFTSALGPLPDQHPITIIVRSNRAMTALKIGEPKVAIGDADAILQLIGPSKGDGETIDLANGEPGKPMKDFFGKALMRKAEALEQLERWADAAQAWRQAVENGHGGSTSIQGRNRCETAAGISKPASKPATPAAAARRPPAPAPKRSALADLQGGGGRSPHAGYDSAAVSRLRKANQAADRADEEKFALTESVDARLTTWKGGKQDNLRALLGSLDTVLWPEAGWKKVNMSELIMPNKVKIQYMKGISKVHPDKLPTDATTEQRMIAGAVFGTLNEAWDKFKKENNL